MAKFTIYFYAGDFIEAFERFEQGRAQVYQTHDEVVRLAYDLVEQGYTVRIVGFVTPNRAVTNPAPGIEVTHLGAENHEANGLLAADVAHDDADLIVAQFPHLELLRAVARTRARVFVITAGSYNRATLRSRLSTKRLVWYLNRPRYDWVSSHCMPSTQHLVELGVKPERLIPWDIPHPYDPNDHPAKQLPPEGPYTIMYAGSLVADKGVPELIGAVALLRQRGIDIRARLAGGAGDLEAMRRLAASRGVTDAIEVMGFVDNTEVFGLMRESTLVAVPSRREYPEGFPLTLFEAIASRTPIVCSDHPMFRLHMIDGVSASVFASGDEQGCADAIERLVADPRRYRDLSEAAVRTWNSLRGPADWRAMVTHWVVEGKDSPWLRDRSLAPR